MSAWNQIVLAFGYVFLADTAIVIGVAIVTWRDGSSTRRRDEEINRLERMYEGH